MKIIARVEPSEKMVNIAHSYKMNYSNIDTILKNKYKITNHVQFAVVVMSTIILKKHRKVMEMEKLLSVWMQHQQVPLSFVLVQEKAKSFYEDLKKNQWVQLSDPQWEAGARSARGDFIELLAVQHKELTNEDLMELQDQIDKRKKE